MKLQQLRYFQTACRYGSITAAANALFLSQPSISAAIRDLEEEFQIRLLDHRQRNFVLTPDGKQFLIYAEQLLDTAEHTEKKMHSLGQHRRLLDIGIPPMISSLLLPELYQNYFSGDPALEVSVREEGQKELLQLLDEKRLDMVFLPHDRAFPAEYQTVELEPLEIGCCMAARHPLAGRPRLTAKDLEEQPVVLFTDRFFQTEQILRRFEEACIHPRILLQTAQVSTVKEMAVNGSAVGFLFRKLAEESPGLAWIPLSPVLVSRVSLVWKTGAQMTGDMRRFQAYVRRTRGRKETLT